MSTPARCPISHHPDWKGQQFCQENLHNWPPLPYNLWRHYLVFEVTQCIASSCKTLRVSRGRAMEWGERLTARDLKSSDRLLLKDRAWRGQPVTARIGAISAGRVGAQLPIWPHVILTHGAKQALAWKAQSEVALSSWQIVAIIYLLKLGFPSAHIDSSNHTSPHVRFIE
jgi:hypothetical protein